MKKIYLLTGFILLFSFISFGQDTERSIEYRPNQAEKNFLKSENGTLTPTELKVLELIEIRVEGKPVTIGKSFAAGEDWLKSLTVRLKNVSDKPISSIRMSFGRPEAKFKESSLGFTLEFGGLSAMTANRETKKIIQPGEEFELAKNENLYFSEKAFMVEKTGVSNISQIIIGMTTVQFEDGNLWVTYKMPSAK